MENQQILLNKEFKTNFWFIFLKSLLFVFVCEFCSNNFINILVNNLTTKSELVFSSTLLSLLLIHSLSFIIGLCLSFTLHPSTIQAISIFALFLTGIVVIIKAYIKKSQSIEEEMIGKLKEEIQEAIDQEQTMKKNKYSRGQIARQLTVIDECITEETKGNDSLNRPLLQEYDTKLQKKLNGIERKEYEKKYYSRKQNQQWSFNEIIKIICIVMLNELGKPTQMAIIVIAAACNINGLIFGATISLFLVTVLGCFFGNTISKYVTSKTIMFITGFSFIVLGVEVIYAK